MEAEPQALTDELLDAKDAFTDDPSPKNKARKVAAGQAITALRNETRGDGIVFGPDVIIEDA